MKKAKLLITGILTICMLATVVVPTYAKAVTVTDLNGKSYVIGSDTFTVKYNGTEVSFPDAQPFVDANNRTLVPVRFISETMGADVKWDGNTQTATIIKEKVTVKVTVGNNNLSVINEGATSTVTMDTKGVLKNDRTYIPFRYIGEALGAWVGYSDLYNTAQIYDDVLTPAEINRLHKYDDIPYEEYIKTIDSESVYTEAEWIKRNPQIAYFTGTGTYGFNNANEWLFRNPNAIELLKNSTYTPSSSYKGALTGKSFVYGAQPNVDFAKIEMYEAMTGVAKPFTDVKAVFRTDLSCVFASRHNNGTYVRGVLLINIPKDADLSAISTKYGIKDPKADGVYETDIEVLVSAYQGKISCVKINSLK